ncbi:uncharacterized protein LOC141593004 [Silene latifolia]|uniref:uncharacterized protein LOC141593004 n=1 Tax=Silene latifolia TaxID=37657 RepID=UPI003D783B72
MEDSKISDESIEKRPGIFIIGSPNVGKRTLLSRLLSADLEDVFDSPSELLVQGWTIDTKYYSADVAVWMAHLHDGYSIGSMPCLTQLAALVMVFDLSELSSLVALKKWVSQTDIQRFDILLCIGNKVDLVPGHPVHEEYSRHLRRPKNSSVSSDADFVDYGISETEGSSLLSNDESSCDISKSCLEWCTERNIEYVEACASNVDFDKCLSVDGDSQGVDRLLGALSAHMWPGMVLKSGNKVPAPFLPERSESSEEDSDYEGDYEILSNGSAELWDVTEEGWVSAHAPVSQIEAAEPSASTSSVEPTENIGERAESSASAGPGNKEDVVGPALSEEDDPYHGDVMDKGPQLDLEDLDHLMSEITNVRNSSRLMPDFQRREMAAKLAMKMAAMFGDSSGDEKAE